MSMPGKPEEHEAIARLRKLFGPEPYDCVAVDDVLDALRACQSSPADSKKIVLQYTITVLFEETKYFLVYPLEQIMKIGHLYGGLVGYGLISNDEDLNKAYNFILDTLKQSPESNIFRFGVLALNQMKHLLHKRHEYCSEISIISHFNVMPPDLIEHVNSGKNRQKVEKYELPIVTESPKIEKPASIITTEINESDAVTSVPLTIDAVVFPETLNTNSPRAESTPAGTRKQKTNDEKIKTEPPYNFQHQISFIFNNINQKNVKAKCAEVNTILKRRYLPWLSVYLTKRIRDELPLHSLYLTCMEYFNCDALNELIEFETVKNIKILFVKHKSLQTKIWLKNLGHWLGLITLSKDKPIPFDLKTMVIDAFVKDDEELAYTLPFVAKILESCSKSKVYGPKTPWTISVLNCLAGLHQTTGLKLIFQFEIEHLCKALNVELKTLITNSPCAESAPIESTKPTQSDEEKTLTEPPENVKQNISFIFNTINQKNVKEKCAKVMTDLERRYFPWLSAYLTKRICDEFQLHSLYFTCLEYFNNDVLNELIEFETVKNIKVLFMKNKSPQTKTWLKNLGHWLGLITLAKNKPIPFDLKTMVADAYVNGGDELAYTLPFVAKTLESCSKSQVYGPKSQWTISVLNCLAELHQTTGLKLVYQFEIELLCKALNVELKEFTGSK